MGKKDRQAMRYLGIKESKGTPEIKFFQGDVFQLPWYFEGFWQKLIVVASFLSLLWTIFTLIVGGVCWR